MPTKRFQLAVICAVVLSCIPSALLAQQDNIPGWDPWSSGTALKPVIGPRPTTYTFGTFVQSPRFMDADEFGRIYLIDGGRQVVDRFNTNGSLDRQWVDAIHFANEGSCRCGIKVISGERVFLAMGPFNYNIRRLGPGPKDDTLFPGDYWSTQFLMPMEDGSFYLNAVAEWDAKHEHPTKREIRGYTPEGKQISTFEVAPDILGSTLGADKCFYITKPDSKTIDVLDLKGKKIREVSMEAVFQCEYRGMLRELHVDINGDIYFTSGTNIYRLDSNGKRIACWHPYQVDPGPTKEPSVLCMSVKRGLVYALMNNSEWVPTGRPGESISRPGTSEVQVYTSTGQCLARYLFTNRPGMCQPVAVAVQSDNTYGIVERTTRRALFYDKSGASHGADPQPTQATYLMTMPGGGYLVSEYGKLWTFDGQGKNGKMIYPAGELPSPPKYQKDMPNMEQPAYDPVTGDLWGLGCAGIVTHLKSTGEQIEQFPENRALNFRTFSVGMAIDHKGFIYMPNTYGHCIKKVNQKGEIVATFGKEGSGLGELKYPEGLAIDSLDRLYVADTENSRIQVFSSDGEALGFFGKRGSGQGEFDRPYGLTISPDNKLWIADTFNDRVVKLGMDEFWGALGKTPPPEPVIKVAKKEPEPVAGKVKIIGAVIGGSGDFADVVYVEDFYRAWAAEVKLPKGKTLKRDSKCSITGTMKIAKRAPRHLDADTVDFEMAPEEYEPLPAPLGMANVYIGDGYRNGDKQMDVSNLAMLVRSWGKVLNVDKAAKLIVINDGSFREGGMPVHLDNLNLKSFPWPEVGQYVGVTGISVSRADETGRQWSGIRLRDGNDISVMQQ